MAEYLITASPQNAGERKKGRARQADSGYPMLHEAIFSIEGEGLEPVFHSLKPELDENFGLRTKAKLVLENDNRLILHVTAGDIHALRAALNMWLRLVNVAEEMQEIVRHG